MELWTGNPTDRDLEPAARLRAQAFQVDPGPVDPDRPLPSNDRLHVARLGDRIVGTLTVWPFGQWFGGRSVPMGGVAGVAVAPEARGRGVARRLLTDALAAMRNRGEVISTLYPTTSTLYRSVGYEFAGRRELGAVDLGVLSSVGRGVPGADELTVETVDGVDGASFDQLRACYDARAATTAGWLDKGDLFWRRIRHEFDPSRRNEFAYLIRDRQGRVRGALLVRHRRGDGGHRYGLDIRGPYADGPAAMAAGFRLIGAMSTMADRASFDLPPEELALHLPGAILDPRDSWLWMVRLVDVGGALRARGYRRAVTASVTLQVTDTIAPWNQGRWSLTVTGGAATATRLDDDGGAAVGPGPSADVTIDVTALAALYTGFVGPEDLAAAGRLTATDRDALDHLGAIFAGPPPRLTDFF
ncbi:MAG: GNAT family N-acetyltransferase [Actinomycetota bacterium]